MWISKKAEQLLRTSSISPVYVLGPKQVPFVVEDVGIVVLMLSFWVIFCKMCMHNDHLRSSLNATFKASPHKWFSIVVLSGVRDLSVCVSIYLHIYLNYPFSERPQNLITSSQSVHRLISPPWFHFETT